MPAVRAQVDIVASTRRYERMLRGQIPIVAKDLRAKHQRMSSDPFTFMRATFYRWCELWPIRVPDAASAPTVIAVGDLHVDNFGTWRDRQGRLGWGVNDLDEAAPMAYTNDLCRLAVSVHLASETGVLRVGTRAASAAILDGYRGSLEAGGNPIVLGGDDDNLDSIIDGLQEWPHRFWKRLRREPALKTVLPTAREHLMRALPTGTTEVRWSHRQAGVGSLGHARVLVTGLYLGGWVAREAKAMTRPVAPGVNAGPGHWQRYLLEHCVRSPDPHLETTGGWVVRALAPDNVRVPLSRLGAKAAERRLLYAMGWETANIHLARPGVRDAVLKDLDSRDPNWLIAATKKMYAATMDDAREWKARESAPKRRRAS